jgi:defect in organelle trafficking protein DotC
MQTAKQTMIKITLILLTSFFIISCATTAPTERTVNTDNLEELQNLSTPPGTTSDDTSVSRIRETALKEAALTLGAQSGLAYRAKEINTSSQKQAIYLRNVFNFGALMLAHGVQPPVLIQANNTMNFANPNALRISDRTYTISKQAQFVTTPLNWRNYLWMTFQKPELPDKTLLPKNAQEEKIWKKYVAIGWENGIAQANSIFKANMARLKRDYSGMLLYKDLLARNMISKPYVATTNLGITGDANTININDKILRITATPQLQTDSKNWKPILVQ